jgi:hypothetical protein
MSNEQGFLLKKNVADYDWVKGGYKKKGFNVVELDMSDIKDELKLIDEIADQLKFPYKSTNWDSVDDWITDLEWLKVKNTVVFIKKVYLLKEKRFGILFEVLKHAKEFWSKYNVEFDVILFEKELEEQK